MNHNIISPRRNVAAGPSHRCTPSGRKCSCERKAGPGTSGERPVKNAGSCPVRNEGRSER